MEIDHAYTLNNHFMTGLTFNGAFFNAGKLSLQLMMVSFFSFFVNIHPIKKKWEKNDIPNFVKNDSNSESSSNASNRDM